MLRGVAVLEQQVGHKDLEVEEECGAEAGDQEQPHQTGASLSMPFAFARQVRSSTLPGGCRKPAFFGLARNRARRRLEA
jgi:hypothetical protein